MIRRQAKIWWESTGLDQDRHQCIPWGEQKASNKTKLCAVTEVAATQRKPDGQKKLKKQFNCFTVSLAY
jgi:hypothetical protein